MATALVFFQEASAPRSVMASLNTGHPRGMFRLSIWSPPPVNWNKIKVDACWKRDSLCGQIRVVAKDWNSGCKAVQCVRVHASTAAMAEELTVLEGCLLVRNLQLQEVVIESDAQAIIQYLKSPSMSCDWELLPIMSRALEVGRSFQSCSWSWSPRSANMPADFVARNLSAMFACGYFEQRWSAMSCVGGEFYLGYMG
ncbi:hypothetical protein C1H46_038336 [Malus baccata]|uniref:RNase H type-1 domain-containing protein n=1 Tax=Malus baccata TaxID=106549 RepID=A0A540KPF9_MALBA|nr:hypothetical protein C1H46_038336 [Malus baccata]